MTSWQPVELLRNIAATGYFGQPEQAADKLATHLERRANISVSRAIDLLSAAGLVTVRYAPAGDLHPKDQLDQWQLEPTAAGLAALTGEP
jgi:hypothetical protein